MPRDPHEDARLFAQVEAIFDRRGLTPEERETVVALLTALLMKGLDEPGPPPSTDELARVCALTRRIVFASRGQGHSRTTWRPNDTTAATRRM
jgi:hypothetical protein